MESRYVTQVRCAAAVSSDMRAERERLQRNKERKRHLEEAKHQLEVAQRKGDYETASRLRYAVIPELEREIPTTGNGEGAMLGDRVTSDDIARVVARTTGIPVQSLLKGERERLVHVRASRSLRVYQVRGNRCRRWLTMCLADGRCVKDACCWTGPRRTRGQRRRAHLEGRVTSPYKAGGVVFVLGPDWRRQGVQWWSPHLLPFSRRSARPSCVKRSLGSYLMMSRGRCRSSWFLALTLV